MPFFSHLFLHLSQILRAVDGVMKEIQDNREEREVLIGRTFEMEQHSPAGV